MRRTWCVGAWMLLAIAARSDAQKPLGSVSAGDAEVVGSTGALVPASAGRILLTGSARVTAKDRTAALALQRGGGIRICRTSSLHLSESADDSLLLGLDRGSLEIRTRAKPGDVVLTPDLRFTLSEAAPLDLALRVSQNGDTCVENRGRKAPTLTIADAFGEASYELKPGQHVLFEHGSLREVVDKETVPCGCPPDATQTQERVSLAEAAIRNSVAEGKPVTPTQAAAAHPFPAAESEGLASAAALPPEPPGETRVLVATTLAYDPNAPVQPSPAAQQMPAPAASKKLGGGPLAAVGRFFKRLFVR